MLSFLVVKQIVLLRHSEDGDRHDQLIPVHAEMRLQLLISKMNVAFSR